MLGTLELDADRALYDRKVHSLVALCYEDERPLQGLAGILDWRFQGALSRGFKKGILTGQPGECAYIPVTRRENTYHLLLVGGGSLRKNGPRGKVPAETLQMLRKNLLALRLQRVGISQSDFGNVDELWFIKHLKGVPLCIVR